MSNAKRTPRKKQPPEMRAEYDFAGGVRGKYARRYAEGTNVVLLAPDVAKVFRDQNQVNRVLRSLIRAMRMAG